MQETVTARASRAGAGRTNAVSVAGVVPLLGAEAIRAGPIVPVCSQDGCAARTAAAFVVPWDP
ncbi:MAG: hypothetical protein FJ029_15120 [Actinobacteria bacterium]|nr:hypothetical protein [Acidimicrobiia bacterium]MBM4438516.1 hypothetical protein [Actinomycetota bacterium]